MTAEALADLERLAWLQVAIIIAFCAVAAVPVALIAWLQAWLRRKRVERWIGDLEAERSDVVAARLERIGSYLVLVPAFLLFGWALAELGWRLTGYWEGYRGVAAFILPGAYLAHRVNLARRCGRG